MCETTNIKTIFFFNGQILWTRTRQTIRSEEETAHLLFVAAIPLGRFHRHEISQIVVWSDMTSVHKQIWRTINACQLAVPACLVCLPVMKKQGNKRMGGWEAGTPCVWLSMYATSWSGCFSLQDLRQMQTDFFFFEIEEAPTCRGAVIKS